ncbi:uncharacterized protein PHALS_09222 [Plasmopara halstedii]|uniref:Uncharacterized protein n=1 Tax=Plasmopara halstedii TaxID=4781 RepID=A0A0P1ADR5_PLAHL|nr:uncharacterized protein PHALS_09222 [Plasmopara halstedii]CEG39167.1 hypothetical protein PHALS_09222 [Plasmopara halstedii]|eukprot:XP_024575536.1 hypothetical protein PHALS_09222 [Plasmopara halstedii]
MLMGCVSTITRSDSSLIIFNNLRITQSRSITFNTLYSKGDVHFIECDSDKFESQVGVGSVVCCERYSELANIIIPLPRVDRRSRCDRGVTYIIKKQDLYCDTLIAWSDHHVDVAIY